MKLPRTEELMQELGLDQVVADSRSSYIGDALSELRDILDLSLEPAAGHTRLDLAVALESLALSPDRSDDERRSLFTDAFQCRRSVTVDPLGEVEPVAHFFALCVDGLASERPAELAMHLRESNLEETLEIPNDVSWADELILRSLRAFVLLCRRGDGWTDVVTASNEIAALRQLQEAREAEALDGLKAGGDGTRGLAQLVMGYNIAKAVDLAATFVIEGSPTDVLVVLERHISNVVELLEARPDPELEHLVDLLRVGAQIVIRSSIWFTTRGLGSRIRDFVESITGRDRPRPILELWPSQRAALTGGLLDPAKRAIVAEMPTSSGKTLIAEFSIVQALALNPGSTVAYLVPTRALVNQTVRQLRADLVPLGWKVEAAVPVFELDPTEDSLLRQEIDVLILTPEKLDLLIRTGHPAVTQLALVVADEAHNIESDQRGARFELLLGTLKREQPDARFLLLTPFLPNASQLAEWLGDDSEATINLSWRPSERVATAATWRKPRNEPYEIDLTVLPSAGQVDYDEDVTFSLGRAGIERHKSKEAITVSTAIRLSRRGGVLVLCKGRRTSEKLAKEIAGYLEPPPPTPFAQAVVAYATSELGSDHVLPDLLRSGVSYHHAGLSHDLRYLIELLIDSGDVNVVCGTTTLAQGVNFPIASVVLESRQKFTGFGPNEGWKELSFSEFWNIAGRAGRALRDRLGLIVFPARSQRDVDDVRSYLAEEAVEISSALLGALNEVALAASEYNLDFVRRNPEMSVFLQYLAHAMTVAGFEEAGARIEDILRSSLVYHQVAESDRDLAESLVRFSRRYLDSIQGRTAGYLALADGTGFSLASVDFLYARQSDQHPELRNQDFWSTDNLFSDDLAPLTSVVDLLGDVPELTLGRGREAQFDPEAVAGIVRDWVNGGTVSDIADHWFSHESDQEKRVADAGRYLYSTLVGQVPWGLGALQKLAVTGEDALKAVGHVPSLVFYGVRTAEAATLRMAGAPRVAAEGLALQFRQAQREPATFEEIRSWITSRTESDWEQALASPSAMSAAECQLVWSALSGTGDY